MIDFRCARHKWLPQDEIVHRRIRREDMPPADFLKR